MSIFLKIQAERELNWLADALQKNKEMDVELRDSRRAEDAIPDIIVALKSEVEALIALHKTLCEFLTKKDLQEFPWKPQHIEKQLDPETIRYSLKNIRTLLIKGFTDEEIRCFCYDTPEFRRVYNQFDKNTGKTKVIDRLIKHADRKSQIENLLTLAKKSNSARYEKYQPYYEDTTSITTFSGAQGESQKATEETATGEIREENKQPLLPHQVDSPNGIIIERSIKGETIRFIINGPLDLPTIEQFIKILAPDF